MDVENELERVLPVDVPNRDRLIEKAAQHIRLVAAANEYMNLTRITDPQQAAIKHVYDSVAPWHHFDGAKRILDAGTGAGFPGIPLSLVLAGSRFTLSESVQKKARFVESLVESLDLPNVNVVATRAEEHASAHHPDIITARAMAPVSRIVELFGSALKKGVRIILYKGPHVDPDLAEAERRCVAAEVLCSYELPDGLGRRTLIELRTRSGVRAGITAKGSRKETRKEGM